jgi:hypothetical protein
VAFEAGVDGRGKCRGVGRDDVIVTADSAVWGNAYPDSATAPELHEPDTWLTDKTSLALH